MRGGVGTQLRRRRKSLREARLEQEECIPKPRDISKAMGGMRMKRAEGVEREGRR